MSKTVLTFSVCLFVFLAACVAPPAPPATQPPAPPTATPVIAIPPAEVEPLAGAAGPAAIVDAAVRFAADELGTTSDSIQVISVEAVEWRNSCLGAERPDEMCLQVITPGYRVLLDVEGQDVAVHTNQDATVMRLVKPSLAALAGKPVNTPWNPAEIHALVVRQVYSVDPNSGEPRLFPLVYLLRSAGGPGNDQALSPADEERIVSLLADLPGRFVWVDSWNDVPLDSSGIVADDGVVISTGNINPQADGSLHVSGGVFFASLAGSGRIYVLEAVDGVWQVTGVTGPAWSS